MDCRKNEYGPVVFERIGIFTHLIISDPEEYKKVIQIDGKYPHRVELEPLAYYKQKKNMCLGTVNG